MFLFVLQVLASWFMLRRFSDSKSSGDLNWRHLWEKASKKSHRRYARACVHPILSDLPFPEALVVPDHSTESSEFIAISSNPANQPIEDQFLYWCQEMEAKQEEQAKQMVELRKHANRLQLENERPRTRLETNWGENSRGPVHPTPPTQPNKGKEPILMGESDPPTNDELSYDSSPLLDHSPPQNNAEAESKKRPPRRSVSGSRRRVRRDRDRSHSELAPKYVPFWLGGMAPQFPPMHHPFRAASAPHLISFPAVRGPEDMLSSPLGPHILSYEPPRIQKEAPVPICQWRAPSGTKKGQ